MSLKCLIYVSLANQEMSDDHLKSLLAKARAKNESLHITGMLLYRDGFFIQALEGEEADIDALFEVIIVDKRHRDVLKISKKAINQRSFPDWTMGFNKIDDKDIAIVEGFSDFLQRPKSEFEKFKASEAEALLNQFKHQLLF